MAEVVVVVLLLSVELVSRRGICTPVIVLESLVFS
jgi:hypothetical protein